MELVGRAIGSALPVMFDGAISPAGSDFLVVKSIAAALCVLFLGYRALALRGLPLKASGRLMLFMTAGALIQERPVRGSTTSLSDRSQWAVH